MSRAKKSGAETSRAKLSLSPKGLEPNCLLVQFVLSRDAPVQKVTVHNIPGPNCPKPNRDKPMCHSVPNVRSLKVQNVMGPIVLSQSVARSITSGTKSLWPKCNTDQSEI